MTHTPSSMGTTEQNALVHNVSYFVSSTNVDMLITTCGLFIERSCMHNKPKLVTCIACVVASPETNPWI